MEQTITVEQLNELSEKGKVKYMGYLITIENPPDNLLLTIGQMIEFLDEHDFAGGKIFNYWCTEDSKGGTFDFSWEGELCDSLWSAVKEILEKE